MAKKSYNPIPYRKPADMTRPSEVFGHTFCSCEKCKMEKLKEHLLKVKTQKAAKEAKKAQKEK